MYGYNEHTKESIKEKLSTNVKWIEKALILLYSHQTEEEKEEGVTTQENHKGFNYNDALILSQFAILIMTGSTLTEYQLEIAKEKLPKYWKQILLYIQSNPNEQFAD